MEKENNKNKISKEEINKNIDYHISEIAREFRNGFEFLKKYPKSVIIFGSSRIRNDSEYYSKAEELAFKIAKETQYAVITGGGPGIMESANKGAYDAKGDSIGMNIILPHEQKINPNVTDSIHFNYFFIRKALMNFSSECYIFFPGGFGTFDELFCILTLIQTKKIPRVPIILFGEKFWKPFKDLIKKEMFDSNHTIDPGDINLFTITDSFDTIIKIIKKSTVSEWWNMVD